MRVKIAILFLAFFFISACSSNAAPVPTPFHSITPSSTITPTLTLTSTQTPTPTLSPTITPTPTRMGGGSGRLFFVWGSDELSGFSSPGSGSGYSEIDFPNISGKFNVFTSNMEGKDIIPLTYDGLDGFIYLLSISPDGRNILVKSRKTQVAIGTLYVIDLTGIDSEPKTILRNVNSAYFLDNDRIIYTGMYGGINGLFVTNLDGTEPSMISINDSDPIRLFETSDKTGVFWQSFGPHGGRPQPDGIWWSALDGSPPIELTNLASDEWHRQSLSPDGKAIAWIHNMNHTLHFDLVSALNSRYQIPIPLEMIFDETYAYFWSPDSSKIFFCTRNSEPGCYLFSAIDCTFDKLPEYPQETDAVYSDSKSLYIMPVWSPDSQKILLRDGIKNLRIYDVKSRTYSEMLPMNAVLDIFWEPSVNGVQPAPIKAIVGPACSAFRQP